MKITKILIVMFLTSTLLFSACSTSQETFLTRHDYVPDQDNSIDYHENIEDIWHEFFVKSLLADPMMGTRARYPQDIVPRQDDKLTPSSYGYLRWKTELAENTLARLEGATKNQLTAQQELNLDVLNWYLHNSVAGKDFIQHNYLITNFTGLHLHLPRFMETHHQVNNLEDAENFLSRLEEFPTVFAQLLYSLEIQRNEGIIPPSFVVDTARTFISNFISGQVTENTLYTAFLEKVHDLPEKEELAARAERIISEQIYPAYDELLQFLDKIRDEGISAGVWELPRGDDYYRYLVSYFTTTDITPGELHQLGLDEVERLQLEIIETLSDMGYSTNNPNSIRMQISSENQMTDRDEILAAYQDALDEAYSLLPLFIDVKPQAPVEIRPVPPEREAFWGHSYQRPPADGSAPGVFKLNLSSFHAQHLVKALTFHETVPGHHLQLVLHGEIDLPLFRDLPGTLAFEEGWAMYSEGLPFEFHDDPLGYLGYLERQLMTATLLVVDTGIHHKKWNIQQARRYFSSVMGYDMNLERYVAWPGQVTSYHTGYVFIRNLRTQAEEELGDNFDLKEFHNALLLNGSVPLAVLEAQIQEYINANR